jgi:hypothetical protein
MYASTYIQRYTNWVTRLGEFSTIGRMFTLGSFVKISEVVQLYEVLFSTAKFMN